MNKARSNNLFIVISAPSGTGKTSICRHLLALCPGLRFSVSHTTRTLRPEEEEGRDYFFVSEDSFREMIARGEFVEWVENYGQFYGTSIKAIESCSEKGCDLIIDVEPRGASKLKEKYPDAVFVFLLPPSMEELKDRLRKRGFEGEGEMKKRLDKAREEIREVVWYDYAVFNDCLDEAVARLHAIYIAEKTKRERLMERISAFFDA